MNQIGFFVGSKSDTIFIMLGFYVINQDETLKMPLIIFITVYKEFALKAFA